MSERALDGDGVAPGRDEALILEFKGVTADQYKAVNTILGIDAATGDGDWPVGLLSHTGAGGAGGDLVVFEVWESQMRREHS